MKKNILLSAALMGAGLISTQAMAAPFNSMDPRSFAMGGAGVSSGTSGNAALMNPALLSAVPDDDDFSIELPIVAARLYDPGDLQDGIDDYKSSNVEGEFDAALRALKDNGASAARYSAVAAATNNLLSKLEAIANDPVQAELMGGMVVGVPNKTLGASVVASGRVVLGGILNMTAADRAQLSSIANQANNQTLATNTVDVFNSGSLTSTLDARGAYIQEVGIALSREFDVAGGLAFGLTPKVVKVRTFDYSQGVSNADIGESDTGRKDFDEFNLDVGVAKDFGVGFRAGFVIKDLIGKEYETALGNKISLDPQARIGVSHSNEFVTVAVDLDLTENEPAGYESKSQYLALGAELDIFDTVQLRVGYKSNLSDDKTSAPTVGFGFSPFGVHVDAAVSANDDEVSASLQLGFRF